MKLVRNQSFTLTTSIRKQSKLQCLRNSFSQGSVLAPFLFYIYTYDLPVTVGRKFVHADGLAILHYASNWQALEWTLTQDMATPSSFYKWKLVAIKTVLESFHLCNKEAQCELNIIVNGQALPFCAEPTYFGI